MNGSRGMFRVWYFCLGGWTVFILENTRTESFLVTDMPYFFFFSNLPHKLASQQIQEAAANLDTPFPSLPPVARMCVSGSKHNRWQNLIKSDQTIRKWSSLSLRMNVVSLCLHPFNPLLEETGRGEWRGLLKRVAATKSFSHMRPLEVTWFLAAVIT